MGCMQEPTCSINCTVSTILTLLHLVHLLKTLDKVYSTNYITLQIGFARTCSKISYFQFRDTCCIYIERLYIKFLSIKFTGANLCIYVVVQFYPWFKFCFPLFLGSLRENERASERASERRSPPNRRLFNRYL